MKNSIIKIFILNLIIFSLITYILGLTDTAFKKNYLSDNIILYVINSIKYFIFWVLPNWWISIFCGSLSLTFLYGLIRKIFKI
ncbi:hypothetical protein ASE55_19070 [Chryseobacterium sp. Leaf201]|nr:hypothetical protein ASE55_19070 [Chryseobacterium sp. Leaf201]